MCQQEKPVCLVLGGTVPHCELICQLKQRGYYTVLIDYLDNSPAKAVADVHEQVSTLDPEAVLRVAREYDAALVISGCVDQANVTACYVMEQLGKTPPYSYEASLNATNKKRMKRIMMDHGVPTSKYYTTDREDFLDELEGQLRYPLMVKPVDGNSANGVKKVENAAEGREYLRQAIHFSRSGQAIVEEFVSGREISAYCFVRNHKAKLLMTAERISTQDGPDRVIKCYSSIAPARISAAATENAERIATRIAEAFELDNTALFFQGIVSGDEIFVIEFAARQGGGVSFQTIRENTGFDVISAIIDSWEGKPVDFSAYHAPERKVVINTIYGENAVFDHLEGVDSVLDDHTAIAFYQIRSAGDRIDNSRASSSRVAFFIVNAADEQELLQKVDKVYQTVRVLDADGRNIIRRDLNLSALRDQVF